MQAMSDMGRLFGESDSDSIAMIVLESDPDHPNGDQPLGDDAHAYYDQLIERLKADPDHVRNIQDMWGDPLTEAARRVATARRSTSHSYLAGNMGETESNESVAAVRDIVDGSSPPPGVRVHLTGPAALTADVNIAGETSMVTDRAGHLRRHHRVAAVLLPVHRHRHPAAGDGRHPAVGRSRDRRGTRPLPGHRAVDVRGEPVDLAGRRRGNRLCDLPGRAISGGPPGGRRP